MKKFIAALSCWLIVFLAGDSYTVAAQGASYNFPSLKVPLIKGDSMHLDLYMGKKILFYLCNANMADSGKLVQLDSLAKDRKNELEVVVIPINDFLPGSAVNLNGWRNNAKRFPYLFVTRVVKAKPGGAIQRDPLVEWITSKDKNGHFNCDIRKPGIILIMNERNRIFANFQESIEFSHPVFIHALNAKR
jgi:hypothetical protein